MMHSLLQFGFLLGCGGVWIASEASAETQLPVATHHPLTKHHPSRNALGKSSLTEPAAAASPGQPALSISILVSPNGASEVVVSGIQGGTYGVAASEDLRLWTPRPAQTADASGRATFPFSLSSSRLFFRAYSVVPATSELDPPEVAIGKRLFLETRFAQFFFAHSAGDLNSPLTNGGDPVMDRTVTLNAPAPGPFIGQSMNCRACHLTDEQKDSGLGNRTFADFAIRSPIPDRGDGLKFTSRNSPALVNSSVARPGAFFLHFDGEFPDARSLVKATFPGRNFGWLSSELEQAIGHIAKVIRQDNGQHFLGSEFGGAYRTVLAGADPAIRAEFRLPEKFRIDVSMATDSQILETIAQLVEAYVKSLTFVTNDSGEYDASPYDLFLKKNALPRRPEAGQDDTSYSRRLRALLGNLTTLVFVTPAEGSFTTQKQNFSFGPKELAGLQIFLAEPNANSSVEQGRVGNCIACHAAPHFTDFNFHNTGATQWEYDSVHGEGSFSRITIPGLTERLKAVEDSLPATPAHPAAKGRFKAIPAKEAPGDVDLGLWNVYANSDFAAVQDALQALLSPRFGLDTAAALLPKTIALFKTPGLRDLGHSAPYLHTGQSSTIESVVFFYRFTSDLARARAIRNGDPDIAKIFLTKGDLPALSAFLRSLNEDYE